MKSIIILVLVTVQVLTVYPQQCDKDFVPVIGMSYLTPNTIGVELGVKGENSKFDLLFGITQAYKQRENQKINEITNNYPSPGMYWKLSYRIRRVDYVYSLYCTTRYILNTDNDYAPGVSVLFHVMKKFAISFDPYYTIKANNPHLQTTLYLRI